MTDLHHTLAELRRELAEAGRLAPEERVLLEAAMRDIQQALERTALLEPEAPPPGEALEGAAVRLEAEHPGVASAVRALVDALGKAGI